MNSTSHAIDALFILLGAIMVLAMHSGFAFLELGTVREKNQVNALVKNCALGEPFVSMVCSKALNHSKVS